MSPDLIAEFLAASVRIATPLALAALGETIGERGGVINLGVEGAMLTGALAAAIGATLGGPLVGVGASMASGAILATMFALVAVVARTDQIIAGTAVTLGSVGLTGVVFRQFYGPSGVGLTLPTLPAVPLPWLSQLPLLGEAFFNQPVLTYVAMLLVPAIGWMLYRSRWGLELRAAGEGREAARTSGIRIKTVRTTAVVTGGALAGLAGASLVLAQVGTFTEQMTAGRGFVAIAIVVLGRWNPWGVALAALLFGMANASQFLFQSMNLDVPYQFFLMLPYFLTIVALAGVVGRVRAPAELGRE